MRLQQLVPYLLMSIIFFVVHTYGQDTTRLTGFWGIKFGASKNEAKKIMLSKEGVKFDLSNSIDNNLIFDNVKFAGRKTDFVMLIFDDDKFITARVAYTASLESKTIELYQEIQSDLINKYGTPDDDFKIFQYPYEKGDGHEITAIKLGKATITCFWGFVRSDYTTKNYISLEINEGLSIILTYQDSKLAQEHIDKEKKKASEDY